MEVEEKVKKCWSNIWNLGLNLCLLGAMLETQSLKLELLRKLACGQKLGKDAVAIIVHDVK